MNLKIKLALCFVFFMIIQFNFTQKIYADTLLHDLETGTIITFSDKQWIVLEQKGDGTTYILLNSNDGNRAFDPDNTQLFNPSDSNNIGYYLNNTFYNSLSQKDLIETYSWDRKYEDGSGSQANVNAKIGLISVEEFMIYKENQEILMSMLSNISWTRTPNNTYETHVYYWHNYGSGLYGYFTATFAENYEVGVRPALYLKAGVMMSDVGIAPDSPTELSIDNITTTSATAHWNTVLGATSYNVYLDGVKIATTTSTSKAISGLQPSTTYQVSVSAINANGEGNQCNPVSFKTEDQPIWTPLPGTGMGFESNTGAVFDNLKLMFGFFKGAIWPFIAAFIALFTVFLLWKIWRRAAR